MKNRSMETGPERKVFEKEVRTLLEAVIESLPEDSRTVFVMREVEEFSSAETAECLDVTEEVVETRLHRALHSARSSWRWRADRRARHSPFSGPAATERSSVF